MPASTVTLLLCSAYLSGEALAITVGSIGFNHFSMTEHPLVSIVTACYNSERFLRTTIESVRAQTYPHWELIAVDDCSTDSTREILEEFARQDPRIKVVLRNERGGRPAVTKNTGLEHCRGPFLCFLDHDDLFTPDKLDRLVKLLMDNPSSVAAFGNADYIDSNGVPGRRYLEGFLTDAQAYLTPMGGDAYLCGEHFWKFQLTRGAALLTITCMIAVERLPPGTVRFDESYLVSDDTDQWIRIGRAGTIVYTDSVVARYRLHESNITTNGLKVARDAVHLQRMQWERYRAALDPTLAALVRANLANSHASVGWELRRQRKSLAASAAYLRALSIQFTRRHLLDIFKAWLPVRRP